MSVVVRVVRQFAEATEVIVLSKVLVLPDTPTMGARLDLRAEGVEGALTVVDLVLRPIVDVRARSRRASRCCSSQSRSRTRPSLVRAAGASRRL